MDELAKHLSNIYAMDRSTLAVIAVLCAVAAYALKDFMVNPAMILCLSSGLHVLRHDQVRVHHG
jgi:hypothetical protein